MLVLALTTTLGAMILSVVQGAPDPQYVPGLNTLLLIALLDRLRRIENKVGTADKDTP